MEFSSATQSYPKFDLIHCEVSSTEKCQFLEKTAG